ncbi:Ras family small GTPase (macronuclear) [Tetrahymena thermophila SB210]|uniref:Ras family small GTPase n=2 Tax=Tetrahymena thermophila TaxID=5911 RepID=Q236Y2_TETTS|nr:Ras family small GTPase [Tetrahymena thermophila SB210]EAR92368.2 Ras family small GTPase [Tetrahymena thermophila SB210]BAJ21336.1 Rab-family small GTPase Rab8D [Tetrahymena thermophila]|eukprot:XP_001012613.2 Ras family small GTPase [Tetrahymena thermophila SB210]
MSQNKDDQQIYFKILMIGNSAVGNTCLLVRYCNSEFPNSSIITLGIDLKIKKLEINKKKLNLHILDTASQDKFRTITPNYFKAAHGILVAYSVEDQESFEKVGSWIQCIKENFDNANISILLVGNKSDSKQRVVSLEQGEKLAEQYNIPFQETSALNNINVSESFYQLAKMCLDQYEIKSSTRSPQSIVPKKKQENGETKKNCC